MNAAGPEHPVNLSEKRRHIFSVDVLENM
jgi:hypothetical protein